MITSRVVNSDFQGFIVHTTFLQCVVYRRVWDFFFFWGGGGAGNQSKVRKEGNIITYIAEPS